MDFNLPYKNFTINNSVEYIPLKLVLNKDSSNDTKMSSNDTSNRTLLMNESDNLYYEKTILKLKFDILILYCVIVVCVTLVLYFILYYVILRERRNNFVGIRQNNLYNFLF
ncbi:hypothetical protein [Urbanus proteus nucleopolyhedrovirus]|uniref:Ac78 n=1 Tax=Urbanus proteus nucleopolyhedrovirus TaxID=1675866 RepID=A0A162GUT3_9ABAC|nr:hypothetical protein [Urbanus proteus nucleopolyhedrovirus]AKR17367.1 hypothetical protein [Urbanus proteus nucleopolyhedrovirus]